MISSSKPIRQLSEHSIHLISSGRVASNLSAALRELIAIRLMLILLEYVLSLTILFGLI